MWAPLLFVPEVGGVTVCLRSLCFTEVVVEIDRDNNAFIWQSRPKFLAFNYGMNSFVFTASALRILFIYLAN